MIKNKALFCFLLLFYSVAAFAQVESTLSRDQFINLVLRYHPIAQQSKIQQQIAENQIKNAQGNFDPLFSGKTGAKTIEGVNYYQEKNLAIEIPTWYGVNIIGRYTDLTGNQLNNSQTKGEIKQIGVEIPLGKGLFFDQRRAALQHAKALREMTKWEQQALMNDLLLDAHLAYTEWKKNDELLKINQKIIDNNLARFQNIKQSINLGERAAIDSVEAGYQIAYYKIKNSEAQQNLIKSRQQLSVFLWDENQNPVTIPENVKPDNISLETAFTLNQNEERFAEHPLLNYYREKSDLLKIDKRYKFQNLLPKLDFTYNFLYKSNWDFTPLFDNNFQYGLKLEIPIFLRSARANYENAKLKLEQNNWELRQKSNELQTKLRNYETDFQQYIEQKQLAEQGAKMLQQLLSGEEIKFNNGESSLFMINSRENKWMEALEKTIEIKAKIEQTHYKQMWTTNSLLPNQ